MYQIRKKIEDVMGGCNGCNRTL